MLPLRKPTLPGMANPGASPAIGTPTPAPKAPMAGGPGNTALRAGVPNMGALPGMSGAAGMKANGITPSGSTLGSAPPMNTGGIRPGVTGGTPGPVNTNIGPPASSGFGQTGGLGGTPGPQNTGGTRGGGLGGPPAGGGFAGGPPQMGGFGAGQGRGQMSGGSMGGLLGGTGSGGGSAAQTAAGQKAKDLANKSFGAAQYGIGASNQLAGKALNTMLGGGYGGGSGVGGFMAPPPKGNGGAGLGANGNRLGGPSMGAASGIPGLGTNGVPGGPGSQVRNTPPLSSMTTANKTVDRFAPGQVPVATAPDASYGSAGTSTMNLAPANKNALAGVDFTDPYGPFPASGGVDFTDPYGPFPEQAGSGFTPNPSQGGGGLINPSPSGITPSPQGGPQTNSGSSGPYGEPINSGGFGSPGSFGGGPGTGTITGGGGGAGGGSGGLGAGSSSTGGAAGGLAGFGISDGGYGGGEQFGPPTPPPSSPPPGPVNTGGGGQPPLDPTDPKNWGTPGLGVDWGGSSTGGGGSYGGGRGAGGYGGQQQGMTYVPPQSVGSEGYSQSQGQSGSTNTSHGESQNTSINQSTGSSTSGSSSQSSGSGSSFSNPNQTMTFQEGMNILGGNPAREANAANPYTPQQFDEERNRENSQIAAQTQAQLDDLMSHAYAQGMDPNSPAILQARQRILQNRGAQELANTSRLDADFRQKSGAFDQTNVGQNIGQRGQDITMSGQRKDIISGLLGQQKSGSQNQNSSTGTSFGQSQNQSTGQSQGTSFTDSNGQSWQWNQSESRWQPVFAG